MTKVTERKDRQVSIDEQLHHSTSFYTMYSVKNQKDRAELARLRDLKPKKRIDGVKNHEFAKQNQLWASQYSAAVNRLDSDISSRAEKLESAKKKIIRLGGVVPTIPRYKPELTKS